jgi:hypothetical protein
METGGVGEADMPGRVEGLAMGVIGLISVGIASSAADGGTEGSDGEEDLLGSTGEALGMDVLAALGRSP